MEYELGLEQISEDREMVQRLRNEYEEKMERSYAPLFKAAERLGITKYDQRINQAQDRIGKIEDFVSQVEEVV